MKAKFLSRVLLTLIGTLAIASLFSAGVSAESVLGLGVALTSAPFAFALPDSLKSAMTDDEVKGLEALGKQIGTYLENTEKKSQEEVNNNIKAQWDAYVKEMGMSTESFKKLQDTLKEQGIEIQAIKTNGKSGSKGFKSFETQIKEWITADSFKSAVAEKRPTSIEVKTKPMSAYEEAGAGYSGLVPFFGVAPELFNVEVDRRIHEAPREPNFLWRLLLKGNSDAALIVWFNKVNKDGHALITPEYGLKPLMRWSLSRETSQPFKVTVKVKVSTEMLDDVTFVTSEIRNAMSTEIYDALDTIILTGEDADSTSATNGGLDDWATGYAGTALDGEVSTPNNADAVRAAVLQLRTLNFVPDTLLLNPSDVAMLDLTKSTTGNYMKQEIDALLKGLTIIESTNIDAGDFILLDKSKIQLKTKGGLRLSTGWGVNKHGEGGTATYVSDFEINATTFIAEQFLHLYINTIDKASIIKDTFSVVKLALDND